jgi:hypothetical protein
VAKLNPSRLAFEPLETRWLLSAATLATPLPGQGAPDAIVQSADAQIDKVSTPGFDALNPGGTADSSLVGQGQHADQGLNIRLVSSVLPLRHYGNDGLPSMLSAFYPTPYYPPPTLYALVGGDSVQLNDTAAVQSQTGAWGQGFFSQQLFLQTTSQPPVRAPVAVAAVPVAPAAMFVRRPIPQTVIVEEDSGPQRLNAGSAFPPPPAKEQSSIPGPLRDQNGIVIQSVAPISQAVVKDDRPGQTAPTQSQTGYGYGVTPGSFGQAPQVAQAISPYSPERPGEECPPAALPAFPALPPGPETRRVTLAPLEPLAPSVFESALASSSGLLTNVLPIDFSSLESSIKSFFDQIDHMGVQLSRGQANLLFSSGIMAIAAALALQLARRKMQPPVEAVALQREGSIPYSDYP